MQRNYPAQRTMYYHTCVASCADLNWDPTLPRPPAVAVIYLQQQKYDYRLVKKYTLRRDKDALKTLEQLVSWLVQ